jgi:hypothetical protein
MTSEASPTSPDALLEWARANPQGAARLMARNDCGFFINEFGWMRDWQRGRDFKVVERPIQREFRELCLRERFVVGLKARGVGWSSILALTVLWECWAKAPYQAIYLCQREDNAKEFIRKVRFAHSMIPSWMGFPIRVGAENESKIQFKNADGIESEVTAFPSLPEALQTWHPTRIIADEWGLIGYKVLPSALPAIEPFGFFVGLGTAEGLSNEHAQVYTACRDGEPGRHASEGNRFWHVFAPWFTNPDTPVRPSAGNKKDTERMYPENDLEAFALTFAGDAVYPEFHAGMHVAKEPLKPMPGYPIYRSVDFGNTPACVWFQLVPPGMLWILHEMQETEPGIARFTRALMAESAAHFPGFRFIDYGDPSGQQKRDTDGKTCFQIARETGGMKIKAGVANWTMRREAVASFLTRIVDGMPAFQVSPTCKILVQGFMGAYHFVEQKDSADYEAFREGRERERRRMNAAG